MNSMTGYGRASLPIGIYTITVQVSSVNRKGLDLSISLPREWNEMESGIAELVRRAAARGKVNVLVELRGREGSGIESTWDQEIAAETLDSLKDFVESQGGEFTMTPDICWQVLNAQKNAAMVLEAEEAQPTVLEAVEEALRAFVAMRAKEGEALLVDFLARIETVTRHVSAIMARAPGVVPNYRELLMKRLRDAGLELDLSDERVLKEVAIFADRCDISEELTRLKSHLGQLGTLMKSRGEIGRKAEFILQEIGREVHTIGSKANDLTISQTVIELKNELERIREQVANVE